MPDAHARTRTTQLEEPDGEKRRMAELETRIPESPGASAVQLHTVDDSDCVSSIPALSIGSNDSVRDVDLSDISRLTSSGIYEGLLFGVETEKRKRESRMHNRGLGGRNSRQLHPFRKCDKKSRRIAHLENKHSGPSTGGPATSRGLHLSIALYKYDQIRADTWVFLGVPTRGAGVG